MESSAVDKAKEKSEKAKVRRWILKAVEDVKDKKGATVHNIQNFLDSKQDEIANRQEWKLILKKLLDSGHLTMKDGRRYAINKSRKTSGKEKKKSTPNKAAKKVTKKPKVSVKKT
ncbi:hypothetical protein AVEN_39101-1 [Araneus ventricosus]|uniref:H15 domain-containing protein n=1 Tax=Araneus ventricosus TaxID=182803 RepID=A0A4Y2DGC6_ARAVE|nr:hypothetical protein AVEN_39101-1 [Araneus ventricosus]